MTTGKKFFLSLFYIILLIYALEALLFLFTTPKILTIDVRNERIKIAKKKSIEFDMRSRRDAFLDLKKINDDLQPKFFLFSNI